MIDYEESDEEGAIQYKSEFCKSYFLTDDIIDDEAIYFLHDIEEEDMYMINELGSIYLPLDTVNSIRKLLGKDESKED